MLKYHPPEIINCLRKRCLRCNKVTLAKISLTRLKNKKNKKYVFLLTIKLKNWKTSALTKRKDIVIKTLTST
jgi:hypothetical protein